MGSQQSDFPECFWIEQEVEAGAGVELSTLFLTRQTRLAAHFPGLGPATLELFHFVPH